MGTMKRHLNEQSCLQSIKFSILLYLFNILSQIIFQANQNNVKYVPVSKECVLLYDNEFFIRESIERSAFIYKLKITGQIVRFTDIPDNEFCPGYIAITEIFATDRIIVDDDYNSFGDEITFIVGAPIWEIDGKRRINLNGQNSDTHENPNAYNGNRNGNRDGADGLVGFSGKMLLK